MSETLRGTKAKINVGVLGLGGAGRAHIARLGRNPNVGRIMAYDPKPVENVPPGVALLGSREELLGAVDAVCICTPDHEHVADIIACLEHGVHLMVEKPMTASLAEAEAIAPRVRARPDLVFAVHHQMREVPAFRKAADLIRSGELGRVYYIESNYWHDMRERSTQFDSWRTEQGQSLIFGHGCHPLDLIMHLAGGVPVSHSTYVSKNGFPDYHARYTSATTTMLFEDGVVAKSHINSCCEYPQLNDLVVLGDHGSLVDGLLFKDGRFKQVADFYTGTSAHITLNVVNVKLPAKLVSFCFRAYLGIFNWLSNWLMSHPDFGFRRYPLTIYNHDGACQAMLDNFVAAIRGEAQVLVGLEDALRVIRLCEEAEADALAKLDAR